MLGKYQKLLPYRRARANAWTRSTFGQPESNDVSISDRFNDHCWIFFLHWDMLSIQATLKGHLYSTRNAGGIRSQWSLIISYWVLVTSLQSILRTHRLHYRDKIFVNCGSVLNGGYLFSVSPVLSFLRSIKLSPCGLIFSGQEKRWSKLRGYVTK